MGFAPAAVKTVGGTEMNRARTEAAEKPAGQREFAAPPSGRETMRRRYFPNLALVTSANRKVKFYDDLLKDKLVVLNFMYADCQGICPTIISNLKRVRRILDTEITRDVYFYSITVRPEVDSPAKLRAYTKMHNVNDAKWLFLTGRPEDVDMLRHLLGFADPDPGVDKDKTKHSGMIRYGNEPLSIWGSCQGSGDPQWMAQEIAFAIPRQFKRHPRVNEYCCVRIRDDVG